MAKHRTIYKNPEVDLRLKYPTILKVSLLIALFLVTSLFYAFKIFESEVEIEPLIGPEIIIVDIPPTRIDSPPPPPLRPEMPIAGDDADIPESLTISPTEIPFDEPLARVQPQLPPEEPEPTVPFPLLSEKPVVIHKVEPYYPEMARKAGIQGMVVLEVLIGTDGSVEDVKVAKSIAMLDDAAIAAAIQFKFKPGKQRDRLVRVWMSVPFQFRLKR